MRDARPRATPELPRRQLIDGLAGRSWMSPRGKRSARAKRKLEGRKKIANGTAGQTRALLRANPVGSAGFGGLLVRTAGRETVRKNRGRTEGHPAAGRPLQSHPGCKGCKTLTLWEMEGL